MRKIRKYPPAERYKFLEEEGVLQTAGKAPVAGDYLERLDKMVENCYSAHPLPLALVPDVPVNDRLVQIPLALEEPSVAAALSYAAGIIRRGGSLRAEGAKPLIEALVYCPGFSPTLREWERFLPSLREALQPLLASMTARGGGLVEVRQEVLEKGIWRLSLVLDVRDSQGANLANSAAEAAAARVKSFFSVTPLMAVVSNQAEGRCGRAHLSLPLDKLPSAGFSALERGRRMAAADELARIDPARGVTHNKGIMNALSPLAVATGNDWRALEASVHAYACREGRYRGLTHYRLEGNCLTACLKIPTPLATVGGAAGYHPEVPRALEILGFPDAKSLSAIAAAAGLLQNFAALLALTGEGIQKGHMRLHRRKEAEQ